ncbi:MAG: tRNA uridine-5-carboxymethylaminomethyl(34) synthesis GTPase MnmE, partial [Firmicutes bacterium]|nr:tRNA uridine-5-carboxymethylaminomethyl(34) synthesis GTPase MnmE [Bacillota bacterium]
MEDTISAVATAWGEGGIGIVRISGPEAKDVLERIFMPIKKNRKKGEGILPDSVGETIGSPIENRRMTYGKIIDPKDGTVVDEVLAVYMKAPYTYTTEDVVEINCHGSIVSLRKTLALTLEYGARIAEPGEFTKRAFLNGRIDLSQAEAVIDLIRAKTDRGFDVAMDQMEGSLSREIKAIRAKLMDVLVNITVNLDYPDEDIEEITYDQLDRDLRDIDNDIDRLLNTAKTGRLLREGLAVAIIGKPNVGKSSLMNRFLRESRAIVTDIPGTTRDVIEESMSLRGIPVKLIDTAGIRETDDIIEKIGIEKSMNAFNRADLVIFVLDGSRELSEEDKEIAEHIEGKKTLVLVNKADLTQ